MNKFIGYFLPDEEDKNYITWCFIIEVDISHAHKMKDGTLQIPYEDKINEWWFIEEYNFDADVYYAEEKDLHDSFNEACKDILRELFEWSRG
jgi:hypothetical protein